jgi:site-specific DNA-cytosine methylase
MVDLFSGLGGASAAMRDRGWRVVSVEMESRFRPDVVADVRQLALRDGLAPDLLWASPPCEAFSRSAMPWHPDEEPDLELVLAAREAVRRLEPKWWVIENVKGAVRWLTPVLGRHTARIGPLYLWGRMPLILLGQAPRPWKERLSSVQDALRAKVPYEISEAVAVAVETALSGRPHPVLAALNSDGAP